MEELRATCWSHTRKALQRGGWTARQPGYGQTAPGRRGDRERLVHYLKNKQNPFLNYNNHEIKTTAVREIYKKKTQLMIQDYYYNNKTTENKRLLIDNVLDVRYHRKQQSREHSYCKELAKSTFQKATSWMISQWYLQWPINREQRFDSFQHYRPVKISISPVEKYMYAIYYT